MPSAENKVTVTIDATIVDRARAEFGEGADSDATSEVQAARRERAAG